MLAAPPFSYLDTLNEVDDGIDKNAELAMAIFHYGLESFSISYGADTKDADQWKGTATSNDMEKARSTLRQFYRDWSEEGAAEREACYGPVITALKRERLARPGVTPMRVLVPGAGLGTSHVLPSKVTFQDCFMNSMLSKHCLIPIGTFSTLAILQMRQY